MESTTPKPKFDDWSDVKECSNCQRWWNDQCDGASKGSVRPCKDFLATRNVRIPEEISQLKTKIKGLRTSVILLSIVCVLNALANLVTSLAVG